MSKHHSTDYDTVVTVASNLYKKDGDLHVVIAFNDRGSFTLVNLRTRFLSTHSLTDIGTMDVGRPATAQDWTMSGAADEHGDETLFNTLGAKVPGFD